MKKDKKGVSTKKMIFVETPFCIFYTDIQYFLFGFLEKCGG